MLGISLHTTFGHIGSCGWCTNSCKTAGRLERSDVEAQPLLDYPDEQLVEKNARAIE
jgi:hypothetical protein